MCAWWETTSTSTANPAPTAAPDPVRPAADPLRDPDGGALARNDDLVETCLYTVTRLPD